MYFTALKCTFQNHKKLSHNEKEPQKSHKKCFKWKKIIIEKRPLPNTGCLSSIQTHFKKTN